MLSYAAFIAPRSDSSISGRSLVAPWVVFLLQIAQILYGAIADRCCTRHCLDLGCGQTGRYRSFVERHEMIWYGTDVLPELDPPHLNYSRSHDDHLPFNDSLFEVVCTYNVIEHFRHPEAMFSEIARCM